MAPRQHTADVEPTARRGWWHVPDRSLRVPSRGPRRRPAKAWHLHSPSRTPPAGVSSWPLWEAGCTPLIWLGRRPWLGRLVEALPALTVLWTRRWRVWGLPRCAVACSSRATTVLTSLGC